MTAEQIAENQAHFLQLGYSPWVAEGLAEQELTSAAVDLMCPFDRLERILHWHGIIGFTGNILDAVGETFGVDLPR